MIEEDVIIKIQDIIKERHDKYMAGRDKKENEKERQRWWNICIGMREAMDAIESFHVDMEDCSYDLEVYEKVYGDKKEAERDE